jgi:translation initiation factor IF-3
MARHMLALNPTQSFSAVTGICSGGVTNIARDIRVNEKIRARDVRVIGEDGQQLGVFALFAALSMARERGLDLVEVAPNSVPPVCRLMDYGRYKYEQQKKDQEAHRTQRTNDLKEVRMAPVIDDHDIETKTNMIRRFVEDGDKVKVTIQFRGAQMRHQEIGRDVLERILTMLRGVAVLERPIIMEGRNMSMFVGAPANRQTAPGEERATAAGAPRPAVPAANRLGAQVRPADGAPARPVGNVGPRPVGSGPARPASGPGGPAERPAPSGSAPSPAPGGDRSRS